MDSQEGGGGESEKRAQESDVSKRKKPDMIKGRAEEMPTQTAFCIDGSYELAWPSKAVKPY